MDRRFENLVALAGDFEAMDGEHLRHCAQADA
jgi:hypothetical protein